MQLNIKLAALSVMIVVSAFSSGVFAHEPGEGHEPGEPVEFNEILAKDRPEAWAMKLVGSELLLTSMGVPKRIRTGQIELGAEAGWLPSLSEEQMLIGFNGTKREDMNRTSLFARPRVTLGAPADISVTVAYILPIRISGIRPNVGSLSVGRPLWQRSRWRLGGRVFAQYGTLKGDITCDRDTVAAGEDPVRNPYMCEAPSNDAMTIRSVGVELASAFALSDRLEPYVGGAWTYFDTEFQTDAHHSGAVDRSLLTASGPTFALTAGLSYRASDRIRLSGELFYTPLDVARQGVRLGDDLVNLRAGIFYLLR